MITGMITSITIHSSENTKTFFLSSDHCQGVNGKSTYPLGDFVATTFHLPQWVVPRNVVPEGWITSKEELVKVFFYDLCRD
jgi:hypothetical protein